jgi:hypothetical protein
MRILEEQFNTETEARAFIAGIELVNDSDVAAHEPRLQGTQWTVNVHDWASEQHADVCPLCGAGGDE